MTQARTEFISLSGQNQRNTVERFINYVYTANWVRSQSVGSLGTPFSRAVSWEHHYRIKNTRVVPPSETEPLFWMLSPYVLSLPH